MNGIITWAAHAQPGDRFTYFTGDLASSRYLSVQSGGEPDPALVQARVAAEMYEDGEVTLVQRRAAPHVFHYEAVRLKPKPAPRARA